MFVVCVHVHVKPENREDFIRASVENGRETVKEPGNLRFDVIERLDDPNRFLLYEVYRDQSGMEAHKQTPHYARWRDAVAPWMAEPREGVKHHSHFPESEDGWATRIQRALQEHQQRTSLAPAATPGSAARRRSG